MKALLVLGSLLVLGGLVWILQGVNVLPGSYMTGDPRWAWRGAGMLVVGIALIVISRRK
jgi:hypothetical protein